MKKLMFKLFLLLSLNLGVFASTEASRNYDFVTDRDNSIPITASRVDLEFDDIIGHLNRKVQVKSSAPSGPADGDTWIDIGQDPPVAKMYDATNTAWITIVSSLSLSDITTSTGDEDLADALENFISGCYIYRVDGDNIGCTTGSLMINSKLRRLSSAITNATYSAPDNGDWLDVWALADAAATTFTLSIVDSGTTPGGSSNPGTNGRLLGSFEYINGTTKISHYVRFRDGYVEGWDSVVGDNTDTISHNIPLGVTFSTGGDMNIRTRMGSQGSTAQTAPNAAGVHNSVGQFQDYNTGGATGISGELVSEVGTTWSSSKYYVILFKVVGDYS